MNEDGVPGTGDKHRYDRRGTDDMAENEERWLFCLACEVYHHVLRGSRGGENADTFYTLVDKL